MAMMSVRNRPLDDNGKNGKTLAAALGEPLPPLPSAAYTNISSIHEEHGSKLLLSPPSSSSSSSSPPSLSIPLPHECSFMDAVLYSMAVAKQVRKEQMVLACLQYAVGFTLATQNLVPKSITLSELSLLTMAIQDQYISNHQQQVEHEKTLTHALGLIPKNTLIFGKEQEEEEALKVEKTLANALGLHDNTEITTTKEQSPSTIDKCEDDNDDGNNTGLISVFSQENCDNDNNNNNNSEDVDNYHVYEINDNDSLSSTLCNILEQETKQKRQEQQLILQDVSKFDSDKNSNKQTTDDNDDTVATTTISEPSPGSAISIDSTAPPVMQQRSLLLEETQPGNKQTSSQQKVDSNHSDTASNSSSGSSESDTLCPESITGVLNLFLQLFPNSNKNKYVDDDETIATIEEQIMNAPSQNDILAQALGIDLVVKVGALAESVGIDTTKSELSPQDLELLHQELVAANNDDSIMIS